MQAGYNNTLINYERANKSEELTRWEMCRIAIMAVFILVIFLGGIVANFIVFFVFYRCSFLMTTSNRFIVNLTVCNVLNALFVTPFIFVTIVRNGWYFGEIWCNITGFFTTTLFAASTLTLCVISVDRYCAVVSPLHYKMRITRRRADIMTSSVWLIAVVCALPPLLGWNRYIYQQEKLSCTFYSRNSILRDKLYTIFLTVLCFVVPLIVVIWAYVRIYAAARGNSQRTRRNSTPYHRPSLDSNSTNFSAKTTFRHGSIVTELLYGRRMSVGSAKRISPLWHKDEWKAAVTSLLVVSTFIICWFPYFIIIILESSFPRSVVSVPSVVQQSVILMALSNSALNPLVYVFRSHIVRRELKSISRRNSYQLNAKNTIMEASDETIDANTLNNEESPFCHVDTITNGNDTPRFFVFDM